MRSLAILRGTQCPVVYDVTHAVQLPGARGTSSGGEREHIPVLARAAVAAGVAGLFMETHPQPAAAFCDGPNAWPLANVAVLLEQLQRIDAVVKEQPYLEDEFKRVH
jgi:2-dehydro-3-deoxyphosphooctonate aldolase (KDO 8-P synthase)